MRKIFNNFITCFKVKPISCQQFRRNLYLKKKRIIENYRFNCFCVQTWYLVQCFTGPFLVKYKYQRKKIQHKVFEAIFICFHAREIHLQTVTELTSQAFIVTLKDLLLREEKLLVFFLIILQPAIRNSKVYITLVECQIIICLDIS